MYQYDSKCSNQFWIGDLQASTSWCPTRISLIAPAWGLRHWVASNPPMSHRSRLGERPDVRPESEANASHFGWTSLASCYPVVVNQEWDAPPDLQSYFQELRF